MKASPCTHAGRVVSRFSRPVVPSPHSRTGLGPVGLRQRLPLAPCRVAGKEVETETKKYEDLDDYPVEAENGNGGFFPTRDPGGFPPVELATTLEKGTETAEEDEYDPLRDGPLRYLGYANECGEAFAAWLPPFGVPLSYAIAIGYVLTDTGDKFFKARKDASKELKGMEDIHPEVDNAKLVNLLAGERALDTVVWQLLASVMIPGYTIHVVVAIVHSLLSNGLRLDTPDDILPAAAAFFATVANTLGVSVDTVAQVVEKSVPTFCGLAAIPFIVHPIDNTVHAILNVSMRPALRQRLCEEGQGRLAGLGICDQCSMEKEFPILNEEKTIVEAFRASFDESAEE